MSSLHRIGLKQSQTSNWNPIDCEAPALRDQVPQHRAVFPASLLRFLVQKEARGSAEPPLKETPSTPKTPRGPTGPKRSPGSPKQGAPINGLKLHSTLLYHDRPYHLTVCYTVCQHSLNPVIVGVVQDLGGSSTQIGIPSPLAAQKAGGQRKSPRTTLRA